MAKYALKFGIALAVAAVLSSCDGSSAHLAVLRGNHAFEQGDYQEATVLYLRHREHATYGGWIAYNLGNVYHSLGEFSAAVDMWDAAAGVEDPELGFAVAFNRGVLAYERGQYQRAYELFREALRINAASIAAKRNLELTLRKLEAGENLDDRDGGEEEGGAQQELSSDAVRILEYVRRKEEAQWVSPDQTDPGSSGPEW